jgi:hypothetical protein
VLWGAIVYRRRLLCLSFLLSLVNLSWGEVLSREEALNALATSRCDRSSVRDSLTRLGNEDAESLLLELRNTKVSVFCRNVLADVLSGVSSRQALTPLINALEEQELSWRVKYSIITALGRIGDPAALDAVRREKTDILRTAVARTMFALMRAEEGIPVDFSGIEVVELPHGVVELKYQDEKFYLFQKRKDFYKEKAGILELSLTPDIKLPPQRISKVYGLNLGVLNLTSDVYGGQLGVYNYAGAVRGFQAGIVNKNRGIVYPAQFGLVNRNAGPMYGLQTGILLNEVEGPVYGLQLSLAANLSISEDTRSYGVQTALFNVAANLFGAQAGFLNFSSQYYGIQCGILGNIAFDLSGVQVGLFNFAGDGYGGGRCYGLQLGLLNACDGTLKGLQIGLLNGARNALLPWSIGVNAGF